MKKQQDFLFLPVVVLTVLTAVAFFQGVVAPDIAYAGGEICDQGVFIAGYCAKGHGGCFGSGWTECVEDWCAFYYSGGEPWRECVAGAMRQCGFPGCMEAPAYCGLPECE